LAGHPDLVVLAGANGVVIAIGSSRSLTSWADLRALAGAARRDDRDPAPRAGWGDYDGGAIVQLDYEFPRTPGTAWLVEAWARWDADGCTLYGDGAPLAALRARLAGPVDAIAPAHLLGALTPAWTREEHRARVERIRALIAAGDCYQANLTLPLDGRLAATAHADVGVFLRLVRTSPAPYAALLRAAGRPSVVSHSPERFLGVRGTQVVSAPIKGTRRRVPGDEAAVRAGLLAHPKDRAELAMIVDLVRNDLGRHAVPGSVRVLVAARLLDLPYVHHLEAVIAATRSGDVVDVIAAAFPPGSVTGAPKLRAMAILAELESGPRGPYCGAFGWIDGAGAELAVAIRTLVIAGDRVRLHSGGGIVADSDAAAEWDEVQAKAAAMAAALGGSWP